jgi:hypothetical protein
MSYVNFIPTVWSAKVLTTLKNEHVYAQAGVVNRDYEGEIAGQGDRVKINTFGRPTVRDYVRNTDMQNPEVLDSSQQELVISQAKHFNISIDNIDAMQANVNLMSNAMEEAAYAMRDVSDTYVAGVMEAAVPSAQTIGTVGTPKTDLGTAANGYGYLLDMKTYLDEANVPSTGRFVIIPPWFEAVLLQDDRFVSFATPAADARLRNGEVMEAAGFGLLRSNNVPNTSAAKYKIIAGHMIATSYAEQISDVKPYEIEKQFAEAVKGLHVYGAKVTRPSALAMLIANRPA